MAKGVGTKGSKLRERAIKELERIQMVLMVWKHLSCLANRKLALYGY